VEWLHLDQNIDQWLVVSELSSSIKVRQLLERL